MQLDQHPFFRKIIVPWYDSDPACYILVACMLLVCLFGAVGLGVALSLGPGRDERWIPLILMSLSGYVVFSVVLRLIKRSARRSSR